MASPASFWVSRTRQFRAHLGARVAPDERARLEAWLTPAQLVVFDGMHVADRRHGLDVVATLHADGVTDPEVLVAGLIHDAGKGSTGVWPRVAYALGQRYGRWVWRISSLIPGMATPLARLQDHPERSATLAAEAGCSTRTVELIRNQDAPLDPVDGVRLKLADEAN